MNIVNVGYDSTNYYVLADGKPRLLVDVGFPGTLPKLQHQCKRMDIALKSIPLLFITHFHPDHAGLVGELQQIGCKVIVFETQIDAIPLLKTYTKPEQHYVDIDLTAAIQVTIEGSRDFLVRHGIEGEVISTPGHSDDSVTLVLDNGAVFTGDFPRPLPGSDDERMKIIEQGWQKIHIFGAKTIYPGHGTIINLGKR
jgi:endoribonuclease LACTB2